MKKFIRVAFIIAIAATLLTLPVFASGVVDSLNSIDTQVRDAVAILAGLAGVIVAFPVFLKTRSPLKAIGSIAAGAVIAFLAKSPDIMTALASDVGSWIK